MKKKFIIGGFVLSALLVGAAIWLLWLMAQPLYRPGMVRSEKNLRAPLDPPAQRGSPDLWTMEKDIRLHHFSHGQGRPVLVLHGGPGYPIDKPWPGLDALTTKFQFHYFDQRGCGQSSRPFDRFTSKNFYANMAELERTLGIGAQIADVERIRRLLQQEKLMLVGHSFGGFLAAMYAVEFPERVEALVLIAPSGVLNLPSQGDDFFKVIRKKLPVAKQSEFDEFVKSYLDFGNLFARSEAELAARNRKLGDYFLLASGESAGAQTMTDNGGWMVQAMYLSMGKRHDYRAALRGVRAPALVLHSAGDILSEQASREYAELIPGARFEILPKDRGRAAGHAGHFAFAHQSETFTDLVGNFLKQSD